MSLLGIDIGTTGCKSAAFSVDGQLIASSYEEYNIVSEEPGYAELNSLEVWNKIKKTIRNVAGKTSFDPIKALSVSSLGEAVVPVTKQKEILYNSILGIDSRGKEFIHYLNSRISEEEVFEINGNIPGIFSTMPKISWLKKYKPEIYDHTGYFLLWADFVCFMLGGKPVTNYSLANRTLLFDINKCDWSDKLMELMDLDRSKFAPTIQSGIQIGAISKEYSEELLLPEDVAIISGGHDQCCAALGSGIKSDSKAAMYGMGTFICVVPVFSQMPDIDEMYRNKLHIEQHVVPGSFISFIYNQSGGALIKWFMQTFTSNYQDDADHQNNYNTLFDEIPDKSNNVIVIPRFGATGSPDFHIGNQGCITGLSLSNTRGDILLAVLEGISFYIRDCFENLGNTFSEVEFFVATGGGSVSEKWLQITADILGKTIIRNKVTEASSLGAAIIAGKGGKVFSTFDDAIDAMVHKKLTIKPELSKKEYYSRKFEQYQKLYNFQSQF